MKSCKSIICLLYNSLIAAIMLASCTSHKIYDSYSGLVMAGYQGWFNAEGDGADRGFYHYRGEDGFRPGSATIDMWPEVSEYEKTYPTEFTMSDGTPAMIFSSADPTTVGLHFKWMREYGLDGVFMQRFVTEIKGQSGKKHFDKVLESAFTAAAKYSRAICIMYDLSGMRPGDEDMVLKDFKDLSVKYELRDHKKTPSYLYHNGRPLVAIWGVGFNDSRQYGIDNCNKLISSLKEEGYSVLVGVPAYWRELKNDAVNDKRLHELICQCDIVMPWFVARYTPESYEDFSSVISLDMEWCARNKIDYAPSVFPGFSWRNMYGLDTMQIPRQNGRFFQAQIDGAIDRGAKMIYVAMFDEIDEGTAIFKCAKEVPVTAKGTTFVAIESSDAPDHYLKIAGEASRRLKKNMR